MHTSWLDVAREKVTLQSKILSTRAAELNIERAVKFRLYQKLMENFSVNNQIKNRFCWIVWCYNFIDHIAQRIEVYLAVSSIYDFIAFPYVSFYS